MPMGTATESVAAASLGWPLTAVESGVHDGVAVGVPETEKEGVGVLLGVAGMQPGCKLKYRESDPAKHL
jgi:hypothetical protein